ncbi:MAG: choice-of-anchor D domain-containing protein [Anaerolineae bacterium]|nr:choice-of-anchor D domain-containing protein [Anaerolineae bacterium]MDW8170870.1 choice-of-anchor D domain-containing protein [Anaerolineae bacterium]
MKRLSALMTVGLLLAFAPTAAAQAPIYNSVPAPNTVLDFGAVTVGTMLNFILTISEAGTAPLIINLPSGGALSGEHASDFMLFGPSFPATVADGGPPLTLTIQCKPTALGTRNAILTLTSNDPARLTVTYTLRCTGVQGTTPIFGTPTPSPTAIPETIATVFFVRGLAVRSGPYLGASMLAIARPNVEYPVLARNDDEGEYTWYLISINGIQGWASGRYLNVRGNLNIPTQGSIFDQLDNAPDLLVRGRALDNLNLRRRPSMRVAPIAQIPWGAEMKILGKTMSGGVIFWLHVEWNGIRGWVVPNWVRLVGDGTLVVVPKR